MVYLKSVENVITLGKLIGLLFLFCLPLLSILFFKTKRNDLARPVMGNFSSSTKCDGTIGGGPLVRNVLLTVHTLLWVF